MSQTLGNYSILLNSLRVAMISSVSFVTTVCLGTLLVTKNPVKVTADIIIPETTNNISYDAKHEFLKKINLRANYLEEIKIVPQVVPAVLKLTKTNFIAPPAVVQKVSLNLNPAPKIEIKPELPDLPEFDWRIDYITGMVAGVTDQPIKASKLARLIVTESESQGVDPLLISSIIFAESSFKETARSRVGALGLMQILPSTAKYIAGKTGYHYKGAQSLHDPLTNLHLGIAYIKYLREMFSDNMHNTLVAYNWGPGNVLEALKNSRKFPGECLEYSAKIRGNYKNFHKDLKTVIADNNFNRKFIS